MKQHELNIISGKKKVQNILYMYIYIHYINKNERKPQKLMDDLQADVRYIIPASRAGRAWMSLHFPLALPYGVRLIDMFVLYSNPKHPLAFCLLSRCERGDQ